MSLTAEHFETSLARDGSPEYCFRIHGTADGYKYDGEFFNVNSAGVTNGAGDPVFHETVREVVSEAAKAVFVREDN